MAQSGFTPIQIYYSTTAGNVPLAGSLANGELAINTNDGVLYYKDSGGVVQVLASGSSISISSAAVATTTNLASLSGLLTVDGVTLTAGQRVLVKNQTLSQNNGVYVAAVGAWTRAIDSNSSSEIAGRIISVASGSTNGGEQWATTFKSTDTLGTTAMAWFQVALQNTAVTFTDLTTSGNTTLGDASADTVTVNGSSTFNANAVISLTDNTNAALRITQLGTGNAFLVEDSTNPDSTPFVIDASGRVIQGYTIAILTADDYNGANRTAWGYQGNNGTSAGALFTSWSTVVGAGAGISLSRSRSATVGTQGIVSSGDSLGGIGFNGDDGTNFISAASITAVVDGTPGTNDMPGRLVFSTTPDGSDTPVERARIITTGLSLATGNTYQINTVSVLSSTTLGSTVVSSSLTSVGTIATGTWQGTVIGATYGGTGINNGTRTLTINTNAGTIAFSGASTTMTFPSTSQTLAGLALAQTWTAAQTFRAASSVRAEAAATQDAIVLAGRAGGTGSFAVSLTPTTLSANRTVTLPDGNVTIPSGTVAVLGTAQTFTAAQTFRATDAVRSEAAATQDAIVLAGRAGGTGSFAATITTATLAASVTHTLPAITGTLATLANTGQTFTGQTSIIPTTNSSTITIGAIPQTGTITVDRSQATHTLDVGVGPTLSGNTKTINFGTDGASGSTTNINIGSAVSGSTTTTAVRGNVSANYQADSNYFIDINNPFSGTYTTAKFVGIRAKGFFDNLGTATPYTNYSGYLGWSDEGNGNESAKFQIYTNDVFGNQTNVFNASAGSYSINAGSYLEPTTQSFHSMFGSVALGYYANVFPYGTTSPITANNSVAIGRFSGAADVPSGATVAGSMDYNTSVGDSAFLISVVSPRVVLVNGSNVSIGSQAVSLSATGGDVSFGGSNVAVGASAGKLNAISANAGIGNGNIFVGAGAGQIDNIVIQDGNIAIGLNALNNPVAALQYATVLGGVTGSGVADGEVVIANGAGDQLFHSLCDLALTKHYSVTLNNNLATTLRSTAGISFYDTEFKIVDNTDPTKIAQFECSGITTLTTRTFTLPNASGTLATLANTSQTFTGSTSFSPTTASGTVTLGSTGGTGTITVGRSTVNQTIDIGVGATTAVSTKTITIGTNGVSGSTTNVTIGSAVSGALGTTTLNSNVVQSKLLATSAAAPTIASATTIAPTTQILFVSGTTAIATITPPSPISLGGGTITIIPTGAFTTTTAGNIALASTAVVSRALTMTYDVTTTKWYPSY